MPQTQARIKKEGKNFEILVDLDEALRARKGEINAQQAILTDSIFYNLKSGEHASSEDLKKTFGTDVFEDVAEKIIRMGEIVIPSEVLNKEPEEKYKQVVDFLSKNAVDADSRPYTPNRIMQALKEAGIIIKNKPIDYQMSEIIEQLKRVIPIKIEMKRVKITIPAQHTGKAYGIINEYKESEEWLSKGDLIIIINIPSAMIFDFYDKLNSVTHGSALTEEIKE